MYQKCLYYVLTAYRHLTWHYLGLFESVRAYIQLVKQKKYYVLLDLVRDVGISKTYYYYYYYAQKGRHTKKPLADLQITPCGMKALTDYLLTKKNLSTAIHGHWRYMNLLNV